jgi:hypothetical protein
MLKKKLAVQTKELKIIFRIILLTSSNLRCLKRLDYSFFFPICIKASPPVKKSILIAINFKRVKLQQTSIDDFDLIIGSEIATSAVMVTDRPSHVAKHIFLSGIEEVLFQPAKKKQAGVYPHTNIILAINSKPNDSFFFKVISYHRLGNSIIWKLRNININSPQKIASYLSYTGPIKMFLQSNLLVE